MDDSRVLCKILVVFLCCCCSAAKVKIIFDTDMGSDCDDAGALACLHAMADNNEAQMCNKRS